MGLKAGVGMSDHQNSEEAAKIAATQAAEGIRKPDIFFIFASTRYNQFELLKGIKKVSKKALVLGCSDAGEISSFGTIKGGVGVMAMEADSIDFFAANGGQINESSKNAARKLAQEVKKKCYPDLSTFLFFADSLTGNGGYLVEGLEQVFEGECDLVGASPADDNLFRETFVYFDDQFMPSSIAGVGLTGEYGFSTGVAHGWVPIGLPAEVTKARGSVVYEINDRPIVDFYKEYFGEKAEGADNAYFIELAMTYPLGIKDKASSELLMRSPLAMERNGGIRYTADIRQGEYIRLMLGSKDDIIESAKKAAEKALQGYNGREPQAAIVFSGAARRKVIGQGSNGEIENIKSVLGDKLPIIGFHSYGEFSASDVSSEPEKTLYLNNSITITLIGA